MAENANSPAPADAGNSSGSSTPVADAAAVNAAAPGGANPVGSTGGGGEMATPENPNIAEAPNVQPKLDHDGEPIPVGNEAQRKVAEAIAATFRPVADGEAAPDLNAELKGIIAEGQTQSMAGPAPVELTPTEQPTPDGNPPLAKKVEVKAKGTVTPPPAKPEG